jgi:H+/Cl- antiporter ClcA
VTDPPAAASASPFGIRMVAAVVLTGVGAGLAGMAATLALHLVQHLSFGYTENTFLVGVERASAVRRVSALTIGGALVGGGWWAQRRWIRTPISVTDALADDRVPLPVPATALDALLQIVAVGAGASLGREGAPRELGATIGAWVATRCGVTSAQRRTLLACGAGAGLAAVYNVPLGGALFTVEVLLASFAWRNLVPAVLTAAIATVVAWPLVTDQPTYHLVTPHLSAAVLVWSILIGPIAGVAGQTFLRLVAFARAQAPSGWLAAITTIVVFAALGFVAIAYPQLPGNGKGLAELALTGSLTIGLAITLTALKTAATTTFIASGAVGGVLTPALAIGAALGAFTGGVWNLICPGGSLTAYALVCAAAMLAVTQRAALTAIVLVTEFTHATQNLIAPMIIAVALAMITHAVLARRFTTLDAVDAQAITATPGHSSPRTSPRRSR